MSAYDLVKLAKDKQGLTSDNQIAIKLGISNVNISNWKVGRNNPDGIIMLKLQIMAGVSGQVALDLVTSKPCEQEQALSTTEQNVYYVKLEQFKNILMCINLTKLWPRQYQFRFQNRSTRNT